MWLIKSGTFWGAQSIFIRSKANEQLGLRIRRSTRAVRSYIKSGGVLHRCIHVRWLREVGNYNNSIVKLLADS